MPSFENIEEFGRSLRELAGEEEELRQSGESISYITRSSIEYDELAHTTEIKKSPTIVLEGESARSIGEKFFQQESAKEKKSDSLTLGDEDFSDYEDIYRSAGISDEEKERSEAVQQAFSDQRTTEQESEGLSTSTEGIPKKDISEEDKPLSTTEALEAGDIEALFQESIEVPDSPDSSQASKLPQKEEIQQEEKITEFDQISQEMAQEEDILAALLGKEEETTKTPPASTLSPDEEIVSDEIHEEVKGTPVSADEDVSSEEISQLHHIIDEVQLDESDISGQSEEKLAIGDQTPAEHLEMPHIKEKSEDEPELRDRTKEKEKSKKETEDFTEEEFQKIIDTIDFFPHELKKVVSTYITDENISENDQRNLIALLLSSASLTSIARFIRKKTGAYVEIPRGYVKETVQDLERRSRMGVERFKRTHMPVIINVFSWFFGILLTGYLVLTFLYRPIAAELEYRNGYKSAEQEAYQDANKKFIHAWRLWHSETWLFRFAELFKEKKAYTLTAEKYDQLIYGMQVPLRAFLINKTHEHMLSDIFEIGDKRVRLLSLINIHKKGILQYADFQVDIFGDYQRAEDLISILLERNKFDKEALLKQGDVFVQWADRKDKKYYKSAEQSYYQALSEYGRESEIMERIGWISVKMDAYKKVLMVVDYFTKDRKHTIIPQMHADIAGYLIDNFKLESVPHLLTQIYETNPYYPETYYYFSRYDRILELYVQEEKALQDAITLFQRNEDLRFRRLFIYIDTYIRQGEYYYDHNRFLDAENSLQQAVRYYQKGIRTGNIASSAELGRMYEVLGNIRYYQSNLPDEALQYFQKAKQEQVKSQELSYKIGYLLYYKKLYEQAALSFLSAETTEQDDVAIQIAMGTTLYRIGNYDASSVFLQDGVRLLEKKYAGIPHLFVADDPKHKKLIETLILAHNNLGVTLYRAWQRSGKQEKYAAALYHFEQSITLAENLYRDPITKGRSRSKTLAYINLREVLYPKNDFAVQIYPSIPLDRQQLAFITQKM